MASLSTSENALPLFLQCTRHVGCYIQFWSLFLYINRANLQMELWKKDRADDRLRIS